MKKNKPQENTDQQEPVCQQEAPEAEETQTPAPEQEQDAPTLLELLNAAEKQRDEYLDLAQRTRAEFDNYRRRNQNLYRDAFADGTKEAVSKFIAVLDNLQLASKAQGEADAVRAGVEMVEKQFLAVLKDLGVEEIPTEGMFDPNLHNAVMKEESEEEENTILQVFQKGYKIGDKVLRYSMVKVSG